MVYQYREIGEGDWLNCDKDWFDYCQNSPLHDAKVIDDEVTKRQEGG